MYHHKIIKNILKKYQINIQIEMKKQNRIYNTDMYSYNSCEAVHITKNMAPEELTRAYWDLYNRIYSIKKRDQLCISIVNGCVYRLEIITIK